MQLSDKQLFRLANGREYRAMTMTARPAEGDEQIVEGYAATFGQPYELYAGQGFRVLEQVDPAAFDGCDMSDVIMQYNHEGRVFARNKNGTLSLAADGVGLKVTANLGGTDIGRQLYQEIRGGYTDKMSFCFMVGEDRRESTVDHSTGEETVLRTITKIKKLYDVSAVSLPANDMTSLSARRFSDGVIAEIHAERRERARKIQIIKLLMEVIK